MIRRILTNARPSLWTPPRPPRCAQSSSNSSPKPDPPSSSTRASRLLDRLPPRLQKHTRSLRQAPLSHLVAFLILHEITAVVPVIALFSLFHYTPFTPLEYVTGHWATHVRDGAAKAERYLSRKGWFGFGEEDRGRFTGELDAGAPRAAETDVVERRWATGLGEEQGAQEHGGKGDGGGSHLTGAVSYTTTRPTLEAARETGDVLKRWMGEEDTRYRVVVEVALAWAVTKALLPARILVSVWATPWFANVMLRARDALRRKP